MKKLLLFGFIAAFAIVSCGQAVAITLTTAQQQQSSIKNQLSNLSAKKKELQNRKKQLEDQEKQLKSQQATVDNEINRLKLEANQLQQELLEIDEAIVEAEENYANQQELAKTRLRVMMDNSGYSIIDSLIESKSLTDFFEKVELYSVISRKDKQLIEDLKTAKEDVEFKKKMKDQAMAETKDKLSQKQDALQNLQASREDLNNQIRQSKSQLERLEKQEDELLQQSKELENIIKELTKNSKNTKYLGSSSLLWPAPGNNTVVSQFGMRKHPILKKLRMHTGIDIDADKGDPIVAAEEGTVIISGYNKGGYGYYIVIDHGGGITTLYAHASKLLVSKGDKVKRGDKIALVGSTGLSTGPHLHFEVRKDGTPKDPLNFKAK